MRPGWRNEPFESVIADESSGNVKTPQSEFLPVGRYAVVDQSKELIAGYVDDETRLCRVKLPAIVFGDHTRCFKYLDFPFCMGADGVKVLRPKIDADVKYLYYYLKQLHLTEGGYDRHFKYLKRNNIVLPPLPEQQRIAEILDKADALRVKRRATLAQLDTLAQSIFFDMFGDPATNPKGWPLADFSSVVYFQEGPGVRNWQFRNEGIKLINVKNIVEGKLVIENTDRYLSPDEVKQRYQHFLLDAGDLVVASSGVTWGKIAEVSAEHLPLCLNTSMIRLRPRGRNIEKGFIRAFVESLAFRKQILRLITGSAQPNFGPAHLKQIKIPLPPIQSQREYAKRVAAIEQLSTIQRISINELYKLFASLQHRAFRGELSSEERLTNTA